MRNLTKESRLNSRNYQFSKLLESGYIQETYKELDFFTKHDGKYFTLKVFRGTAANHELYMNYHTAERRAEIVQNFKNNYERRQTYKAEQKIANKGKSSCHAAASAAIKEELQNKFKGVKFSCKSDSFAGGNSVNIEWTDGPTINEVEVISQKYQYGSFNGMEDLYEYTNNREDIPQVKYVQERRNQSEELKALLHAFSAQFPPEMLQDYHNEPTQIFYRIFARTSFPANYINPRIEKTSETCGFYEDFYSIVFDTAAVKPTEQAAQPQYKEVETKAGEINIVDYSEKAFAVIGDTKPLKDKLKELGGSFNPRLSCGAGWIFSKKKLAEVTAALSETEQTTEPTELKKEVAKMIEFFTETDVKISGQITESTKECARVQNIPLEENATIYYDNLKDITAAAYGGKVISLCNLSQLVNSR